MLAAKSSPSLWLQSTVSTLMPATLAGPRRLWSASAVLLPLRVPQSALQRASCGQDTNQAAAFTKYLRQSRRDLSTIPPSPVLHELLTTPLDTLRMFGRVVNDVFREPKQGHASSSRQRTGLSSEMLQIMSPLCDGRWLRRRDRVFR